MIWAIIALAFVGALNAAAAIGAYRRERGKADAEPSGPACRSVFQTPHAHALGLPNGVVGLAFYLMVIALAIARAAGASPLVTEVAAAIALVAVAFSIYLAYLLVFRLRMSCRICHTGNAINVVLAILCILACD